MRLRYVIIGLSVCTAVFFSGCTIQEETERDHAASEQSTAQEESQAVPEAERELFAMDTYMTMKAVGDNAEEAVRKAEEEIKRLDALLSTGDADSEVSKLNESGSGELSEDTSYLMEKALGLYEETEGAFNLAIYPVMELWGFPTQEYRIPEQAELAAVLEHTNAGKIVFDKETRRISFGQEGMKIDFGGIAKGYTSARIMEIFRECGIESGLVNLGGNVQTLGKKTDGSRWKVAVQNPEDTSEYVGVLQVADRAVITSGGYERYFEQDGSVWHHIIDPATGYPAQSGLKSVSVVSEDGTLADGLSTALFIMGREKAEAYWSARKDEFDMILMTDDGTLHVTEGIWEDFQSELPMEKIE